MLPWWAMPRLLSAAGVLQLTSTPPTLEELFLDVYRPDTVSVQP